MYKWNSDSSTSHEDSIDRSNGVKQNSGSESSISDRWMSIVGRVNNEPLLEDEAVPDVELYESSPDADRYESFENTLLEPVPAWRNVSDESFLRMEQLVMSPLRTPNKTLTKTMNENLIMFSPLPKIEESCGKEKEFDGTITSSENDYETCESGESRNLNSDNMLNPLQESTVSSSSSTGNVSTSNKQDRSFFYDKRFKSVDTKLSSEELKLSLKNKTCTDSSYYSAIGREIDGKKEKQSSIPDFGENVKTTPKITLNDKTIRDSSFYSTKNELYPASKLNANSKEANSSEIHWNDSLEHGINFKLELSDDNLNLVESELFTNPTLRSDEHNLKFKEYENFKQETNFSPYKNIDSKASKTDLKLESSNDNNMISMESEYPTLKNEYDLNLEEYQNFKHEPNFSSYKKFNNTASKTDELETSNDDNLNLMKTECPTLKDEEYVSNLIDHRKFKHESSHDFLPYNECDNNVKSHADVAFLKDSYDSSKDDVYRGHRPTQILDDSTYSSHASEADESLKFNDTLEEMEHLMKYGMDYMTNKTKKENTEDKENRDRDAQVKKEVIQKKSIKEEIKMKDCKFKLHSPRFVLPSQSSDYVTNSPFKVPPRTPTPATKTTKRFFYKTPSPNPKLISRNTPTTTTTPLGLKHTPKYENIVSPVQYYIKNSPLVPKIQNVSPSSNLWEKQFKKGASTGKLVSSSKDVPMVLPEKAYKTAKVTKMIDAAPKERLPNNFKVRLMAESLSKPTVIKHQHRELASKPLREQNQNTVSSKLSTGKQDESFANLAVTSGEVSLCIKKPATRTYTLK